MSYRREEIKAGFVVMTALAIFSGMVVLIGGSHFWEKLDAYPIRFSAVGGLEKGASVRLGGLRVGQVLGIAVAPDDYSKIEVTIGVKTGTPIGQAAVASVRTLGLVGDYYVLITQKADVEQSLVPGSLIPSQEMLEIGDLLIQAAELSQTLNASIERVVNAIHQVLSPENIQSIRDSLQGLNRLTSEGEKSLKSITADLAVVLGGLNVMIAHLDNFMAENSDQVQGTILAIKRSAEQLETLSRTMNQTLAENRDDLRSTVTAFREDSQKAGDLLDNLNGRVSVTGDYLEETMANLMELSENLRLLSSQLRRQPWRLIYRGKVAP